MKIYKYRQIYLEIIKLILTNKWPVGSYLKSENELIKLFKVSRLTIRNVLSILENEGRIKRSRGKKTLILNRRLRNKFNSELKDRQKSLRLDDFKVIDFKLISNHLKNKFTSSTSLFFIERTSGIKKKQVYLLSRAYISKQIVGDINMSYVKKNKSLIDILMNFYKIKFNRSYQELRATILSKNDAKIFNTIKNFSALSNTWYFYDNKDNLVLIDEEITIEPIKIQNTYY